MAFPWQTVDISEDFEDATLNGAITETDTATLLTISQNAQFVEGAAACSISHASATDAYLVVTVDDDAFSWGMWYRTGTWGAWAGGSAILNIRNDSTGNLFRIQDEQNNGNNAIQFIDPDNSDVVAKSNATWYWLTGIHTRNATSYWRVYDSLHAAVGTEQSYAAPNTAVNDVFVGKQGVNVATTTYIDGLIIDKGAAYPLLGWDVAAGGTSILLKMLTQ